MSYYRTYKIPVTISRCSNNFGPYQHPEKLIPLTISRLLHGEDLLVHGDGLDMRDWLYVLDHCKAVDMILHNGNLGEIYNIAANNEITNIDMMDRISNTLNISCNKVHIPNRPCHDTKYTLDCTKIERELHYAPSSNFEENLNYTINWYINNKSWLERK
jgi:dTDP-glucose 4,6-dehydratase